MMIKQFIRGRKNKKIGVMIAFKRTSPSIISAGYSLCHKSDEYDNKCGVTLAVNRALGLSDFKMPNSIAKQLKEFNKRAKKYFKTDTILWGSCILNDTFEPTTLDIQKKETAMNLYRVWQDVNIGYDTFDSMVVIAESEDIAKSVHPLLRLDWDGKSDKVSAWCDKEYVKVELVGRALDGAKSGAIICSSFNAG